MNITTLEASMINRIVHDLYQPLNGAEPESFDQLSEIWADCLIENNQDKGVVGSLVKKGLVGATGFIPGKLDGKLRNDAGIWLTQAGWDVYVEQIKK